MIVIDKHVPEWFFNAAKTCIIPSDAYKNSQMTKEFDIQETITADHAYGGRTITLSFHVDDEDSVRCYLFWNGCYIRIVYPQDLKKILLSVFYIEYKDNKNYLEQKADDDLAKLKVKDETFDAFYKEVSHSFMSCLVNILMINKCDIHTIHRLRSIRNEIV